MLNSSILDTIFLSLKVSLCATVAVMVFSVLLATWLVRTRSKIAKVVEMAVYLPMAMPPVALGYGLLLILGQNSAVGKFLHDYGGIDIAFTFLGAVIAAIAVSLGIGVRTVRLALENIHPSQIDNAYILGAQPYQIFVYIILPQCAGAILGGGVLVFIRAISEFGATVVLAGNSLGGTRTLALAIWTGMEVPGQERQCLMLVLISIAISIIALFAVEVLMPSRMNKNLEQ